MTTRRMSTIVSIVKKPLLWLVGHAEEVMIREPFSTERRAVTVQVIPKDALLPLSEGGQSAIVTLACGHFLEWECPMHAYYSPLEAWVRSLQSHVGHRHLCQQCSVGKEAGSLCQRRYR